MNFKTQNKPAQDAIGDPLEDAAVEAALKHFRAHVHHWSEQEFVKPHTARRSAWDSFWVAISRPAMAGSLAAAMLVASIGIPATVHYQHQIEAQRQAQIELAKQKAAEEAALRKAATSIDDDTLLAGIDTDIAQAAPDAMEPLASLMSDSSTTTRAAK